MKRACLVAGLIGLSLACRKAPATPPAPASGAAASPSPAIAASAPAAVGTAIPSPAAIKPVPAQLPAVVAKVNGESVERWELENAVKRVEAQAGVPVPPEKRNEVFRGVLDQLVAYHLLAQESRARKLAVSDADVSGQIAQMRQQFPTEDAFNQAITAQGLTHDQLQHQTRMGMDIAKFVDTEITSRVSVADADVAGFYQQNLDRFKQGETVHASHILIGVPQAANAAQKQQLRAKAQQVLKQVRGGADFAAVAKEQSQDSGSAQNGGDLGFFPKGQMTPAFEAAAFGLKSGAVSGLVETPFGFHIIKVHERRGPRTAPLAEAGPQIKEFLTQQQRESKLEAFVAQTKAKSKIEILV